MNGDELMRIAAEAAGSAHAPYSMFRVGAAVLMDDGSVFTGVNVENRSYGLTNCAERSAIFSAVTRGRRRIQAVAVAAPDSREPLPPCGACRQVISEFSAARTPIYYADGSGGYIESTVGELYPADSLRGSLHGSGPETMKGGGTSG